MSAVWYILMILSLFAVIIFNPSGFMLALNSSAQKAVTLSLSLCGIYLVWLGLFKIAENARITKDLAKPLRPILKFLFGNVSPDSEKYLLENVTANIIGLGGASTVSGIKAAESMVDDSDVITYGALMLIVLNAGSIQLFPTTIISLRQAAGSLCPTDIFLPCLISSIVTSVVGIVLVKIYCKLHKKHQTKKMKATL